jgi:hypothetical protein
MPDAPANEAGVLLFSIRKSIMAQSRHCAAVADSLNEASEKSLKLRVCPSVLHYRWITADLGGNSCADFLSR